MAADQVTNALLALEDAQATKKIQGYNDLLDKILSQPDQLSSNLVAYAQSILGDSVGIVTSRPLLASFVDKLASLPDADTKIAVGTQAIDALAPKVVSFEDQDSALKLMLADSYEQNEDFTS